MSVFDADAEEAALAPPQLVIGGRTYRGRVLSRDELRPHAAVFAEKDVDDEARQVAAEALVRLVYRRPRWRFWWPDPVWQVSKLSPATTTKFWDDFFRFLARMITPETPNPRTSGPSSSPSTVEPQSESPRGGSAGA